LENAVCGRPCGFTGPSRLFADVCEDVVRTAGDPDSEEPEREAGDQTGAPSGDDETPEPASESVPPNVD
jgi:hypothetical protein